MNNPHVICLNRVWELQAANGTVSERIDLPVSLETIASHQGLGGSTVWLISRSFNCPSNLADGQPVFLAHSPVALAKNICLNQHPLASSSGQQSACNNRMLLPVGELLQNTNRVDIKLDSLSLLNTADVRLVIAR